MAKPSPILVDCPAGCGERIAVEVTLVPGPRKGVNTVEMRVGVSEDAIQKAIAEHKASGLCEAPD